MYLILLPSLFSLVAYFLIHTIILNIFFSFSIAILLYVTSATILYKSYDKYRNIPLFKRVDPLKFRIFMIYIPSIIYYSIASVFLIFDFGSELLNFTPIIYGICKIVLIIYYFRMTPPTEQIPEIEEQKNQREYINTLKKPYNYILLILFVFEIISLTPFFISLYLIVSVIVINVSFFVVLILLTRKERDDLKEFYSENKKDIKPLIEFREKYTKIVLSQSTTYLISLFTVTLIEFSVIFPTKGILLIFVSILLTSIMLTLYIKVLLILSLYYKKLKIIISIKDIKSPEKALATNSSTQNHNTYTTLLLIVFIIIFFFLIDLSIVIPFLLSFFICFTHKEMSLGYINKKLGNIIQFMNSLLISASIIFLIIPKIYPIIPINLLITIYLISVYFVLTLFEKINLLNKEGILIVQNLLSVIVFFLISFSIYPLVIDVNFLLIFDPSRLLISRLLMFSLFFLVTLLLSFYRLYVIVSERISKNLFVYSIIINFILIDICLIVYLNFQIFYILDFSGFIVGLLASGILFELILTLFLVFNHSMKLIDKRFLLISTSKLYWVFLLNLMSLLEYLLIQYSLTIIYFEQTILALILLLGSLMLFNVLILIQVQFKKILKSINKQILNKIYKVSFFSLTTELFLLLLLVFKFPAQFNFISSLFISLIIIDIILYFFEHEISLIPKRVPHIFYAVTIFLLPILCFYYLSLISSGFLYDFFIPFIGFSTLLYFGLFYLIKINVFKSVIVKITVLNSFIITILLVILPFFIYLELLINGFNLGLLNTINLSLFILYGLLMMFYYVIKKIDYKELYSNLILKILVILEVIFAGSVVFNYVYSLLSIFSYGMLLALLLSSCFLFLPTVYSYYKDLFNKKKLSIIIFVNSVFLTIFCSIIPFNLAIDLLKIGIETTFFQVIPISLFILFLFLRFSAFVSVKFELKLKLTYYIMNFQIFCWIIFTVFFSILVSSLPISLFNLDSSISGIVITLCFPIITFFLLNFLIRYQIKNIRKLSAQIKESIFIRILSKSIKYYEIITLYSLIITISVLFTSLNIFFEIIPIFFSQIELIYIIIWSLCFIFFLFPYPLKYHLNEYRSEISITKVLKYIRLCFLLISIILSSDIYWSLVLNSIRGFNLIWLAIINLCGIFFLIKLYTQKKEYINQDYTINNIYKYYIKSIIIVLSILIFELGFLVVLLLITYFLVLIDRKNKILNRCLIYFFLILLSFCKFQIIIGNLNILLILTIEANLIILLSNLIIILLISICCNLNRDNSYEKIAFYSLISSLLFLLLLTYTNILMIYSVTISVFMFLLFIGMDLYFKNDPRYKWFIRPSFLLLIFNLVSWISYSFLFINNLYLDFNSLLSFLFTLLITSFGFILLYNDLPPKIRKYAFYTVLGIIIIAIPIFSYLLSISYFNFSAFNPIVIIISLNIGVIGTYIAIGLYRWEFSWIIWKLGWKIWIFVPVINFYLIYNIFAGIDAFTLAFNFFNLIEIEGSILITVLICSLFYIPIIYIKVKQYIREIYLFFWTESLALVYWITQNIFIESLLLTNISFIILGIIVLLPLLWKLRLWKIVSLVWLLIVCLNVLFFTFLLQSFGFTLEIIISIDIISLGFFLMIYSFFPNVRSLILLLIVSYTILFLGIFLLIFFILLNILNNPIISINLALITIAFSLFTSKYVNLNQKIVNKIIVWTLSVNLASLTFFSFAIIPNLFYFSIFFSLSVLVGSILVINHFRLISYHLSFKIPWIILGFSTSASIFSLLVIVLPENLFLIMAISSLIITLFLRRIVRKHHFIFISLYPLTLSFFILEIILIIPLLRSFIILIWFILFISLFQIIFNLKFLNVKNSGKKFEDISSVYYINEKRQSITNLICFLLNSFYISLISSLIIAGELINNVLIFFIIWSILLLFVMKYVKSSRTEFDNKSILPFTAYTGLILYFIIAVLIGMYYLINFNILLISSIEIFIGFIIAFVSLLLVELALFDIYVFKFLRKKRNVIISTLLVILNNAVSLLSLILLWKFTMTSPIVILLICSFLISFLNLLSIKILKVNSEKNVIMKAKIYSILRMTSLILLSATISSLISENIIKLETQTSLDFLKYLFIFFLSFSIINYILSLIYRSQTPYLGFIRITFFLSFQIFFALTFFYYLVINNLLNSVITNLIILIELLFSFILLFHIKKIPTLNKEYPLFLKINSLLSFLTYLEIGLLSFSAAIGFIGFLNSLFISHLIFIILLLIDISFLIKIRPSFSYLLLLITYGSMSIVILIQFINLSIYWNGFTKLGILVSLGMQFITNLIYYLFKINLSKNIEKLNKNNYRKWYNWRKNVIGAIFYILLIILLQEYLIPLEILIQILILSSVVFIFSIIDQYLFKFLSLFSKYIRLVSWIIIIGLSNYYLIQIYLFYSLIYLFPTLILLICIEIYITFMMISSIGLIEVVSRKSRIVLVIIMTINIISWPFYFFSSDLFLNLNLVLLSILILISITYLTERIFSQNKTSSTKVRKWGVLLLGILLSFDIYLLIFIFIIPIMVGFTLTLNLEISILFFILFISFFFNFFKKSKKISFIFWLIIWIIGSSIVYEISLLFEITSITISLLTFIIGILLFPFIFLFELVRELFVNMIETIQKFIRIVLLKMKTFLIRFKFFVKQNYLTLWTFCSIGIGFFLFYLLNSNNVLNIENNILVSIGLITFLISYVLSHKKELKTSTKAFKYRIIYLSSIWVIFISIILNFIQVDYYIITIFVSIIILGAVFLPYIYYKEKKDNISIKWRFYFTLFFIIILIITGILLYLQINSGLI